jgi:hypothetical protein
MVKTTITTKDNSKALIKLLEDIKNLEVYVGVPQDKSTRKGDEATNAELCYIHTNGSPINHIPARPIIEPAIELPENKEAITEELSKAAEAVLSNKPDEAKKHLALAGMLGQNAARSWFTDPRNNWPENSPLTAQNKLSKLSGKEQKTLQALIDAGASITDKNISKPLIDTGELRKSIVYVVK